FPPGKNRLNDEAGVLGVISGFFRSSLALGAFLVLRDVTLNMSKLSGSICGTFNRLSIGSK
ncbi:hypothetical protein, partial [Isoptericola croceus]|uniref:hypothetical protein n=1 Tax=Isoptericola croceus TaxID=3031406 RepID=UPI0023FA0738